MSELPIKRSETIGALVAALAVSQSQFETITRTHQNDYTGSKYADLADVIAATQPALSKNGLAIIQVPIRKETEQEAGAFTLLAHSSGEFISTELMLPATAKATGGATKFDQQSIGSAITYARRYTWQALVGVAAEEDDDGNSATDRSSESGQSVPKPKTVKAPPVSQKVSSQGGERPNDSQRQSPYGFETKVTTVPALPQEPVIIAQSAPQTNDPAPVEPSAVPPAVIPPFQEEAKPALTPVESVVSGLKAFSDKLKSSEKPTKTQFDAYTARAIALKVPLEKAGLKPSKNLPTGGKLKKYLLDVTGVKELTDLAIYQWEDFFLQTEPLAQSDPVQLVNLIEGGKTA